MCSSDLRVLPDPSPERVRELVDKIVNAKIAAGQLDQSPLTLREISRTKDVLARALSSMYHHRVDYPSSVDGVNGSGDAATGAVEGGAAKSDGVAPADAAQPTVPASTGDAGASAEPAATGATSR